MKSPDPCAFGGLESGPGCEEAGLRKGLSRVSHFVAESFCPKGEERLVIPDSKAPEVADNHREDACGKPDKGVGLEERAFGSVGLLCSRNGSLFESFDPVSRKVGRESVRLGA